MKYESKVDDFIKGVEDKFFSNLESALGEYEKDIREALDVPPMRTGKTYKDVKGKAVHTAAAPSPELFRMVGSQAILSAGLWEPPARLSGELLDSIDRRSEPGQSHQWSGMVYSTSPYVEQLEMGRGEPRPMAPRPAWYTTFVSNWSKYADIALEGFRR